MAGSWLSSSTDVAVDVAVDPQPVRLLDASAKPLPLQPGGIPRRYRSFWSLAFSGDGRLLAAPLFVGTVRTNRSGRVGPATPSTTCLRDSSSRRARHRHGDEPRRTHALHHRRLLPARLRLHDRRGCAPSAPARSWGCSRCRSTTKPGRRRFSSAPTARHSLSEATPRSRCWTRSRSRPRPGSRPTGGSPASPSPRTADVWRSPTVGCPSGTSSARPRSTCSPLRTATPPARRGCSTHRPGAGNLTALSPDGNTVYGTEKGGVLLAWDLTGAQGFLTTRCRGRPAQRHRGRPGLPRRRQGRLPGQRRRPCGRAGRRERTPRKGRAPGVEQRLRRVPDLAPRRPGRHRRGRGRGGAAHRPRHRRADRRGRIPPRASRRPSSAPTARWSSAPSMAMSRSWTPTRWT